LDVGQSDTVYYVTEADLSHVKMQYWHDWWRCSVLPYFIPNLSGAQNLSSKLFSFIITSE